MKNRVMTELQRQALEHWEKARSEGLSISAYSRTHGISAQRIFDTVGRLRRRGALPADGAKSSKFIAVRIAPPPAMSATLCRVTMPSGLVIECLQWPPGTWLGSVARAPDAAP